MHLGADSCVFSRLTTAADSTAITQEETEVISALGGNHPRQRNDDTKEDRLVYEVDQQTPMSHPDQ